MVRDTWCWWSCHYPHLREQLRRELHRLYLSLCIPHHAILRVSNCIIQVPGNYYGNQGYIL